MARRKNNKKKNKQAKVDRTANDAISPAANELDLMLWLSKMNLSDEQFVEQFQQIALSGDFDSVQKLMPWLPENTYFDDTCTRSRAVLDAGQQDIFVLLSRTQGYKSRNPLQRILPFLVLLMLVLCAIGFYTVMYVD